MIGAPPPPKPKGQARPRFVTATIAGMMCTSAALGTGCTDKGPSRAAVAEQQAAAPVTFLVIGDDRANASQSRDALHQAWTQLVFIRSLPRRAIYVDLAGDDATVADARRTQVPAAADLRPTIVAVWLGHGDSQQGTPADRFESELGSLVDDLRRAVASPPSSVGSAAPSKVRVLLLAADPYVDAVRRAGQVHDAEVVDVHGVAVDTGEAKPQQQVADAVSAAVGKVR